MPTKKKQADRKKTHAALPETPARAAFREFKQSSAHPTARTNQPMQTAQAAPYTAAAQPGAYAAPAFGIPIAAPFAPGAPTGAAVAGMGMPMMPGGGVPVDSGIVNGIGSTLKLAIDLVNAGLANGLQLLNQGAYRSGYHDYTHHGFIMDHHAQYPGAHHSHCCDDAHHAQQYAHHGNHYYDSHCHDCCEVLGGCSCGCSSVGNCC